MEKCIAKNVWGKGGSHAGQYKRHSVDRDVLFFIGWPKLTQLIGELEQKNPVYRDVAVVAFKCAARISEGLSAQKQMFTVLKEPRTVFVRDFPLLKRWKKKDTILVCLRCGIDNSKFETVCKNCNANLVFSARKRFVTERIEKKRMPFFIPLEEELTDLFLNRIEKSTSLLFPSPYTANPYSRQWAYNIIKDFGNIMGLDNGYNHWFRAQRLAQLGNEKGFAEDELKAFSGIVKSETLGKYVKKIESYTDKLGLAITSDQFTQLMDNQKKGN